MGIGPIHGNCMSSLSKNFRHAELFQVRVVYVGSFLSLGVFKIEENNC